MRPGSYDGPSESPWKDHGDGRSAVAWQYETENPGGLRPDLIGLIMYDENGAPVASPLIVDDVFATTNGGAS